VVTLQGIVESEAAHQAALETARTTPGVLSVEDKLVVVER
jgi:osmotically-inducible protein OsmY